MIKLLLILILSTVLLYADPYLVGVPDAVFVVVLGGLVVVFMLLLAQRALESL